MPPGSSSAAPGLTPQSASRPWSATLLLAAAGTAKLKRSSDGFLSHFTFLTLRCKAVGQIFLGLRRREADQLERRFVTGSLCGVAHHLLQGGQIFQIALAPGRRHTAQRLRTVMILPSQNLHHLGVLQHAQVPAQVAVGQCAKLLQIDKRQTFGVRDQRRENAEPRALVNHAVQPFVCEAAFDWPGFRFHRRLPLHSLLQRRNKESPPPVAALLQTERPSPRARARERHPARRTPIQSIRTSRPRSSSVAEEIGTTKTRPSRRSPATVLAASTKPKAPRSPARWSSARRRRPKAGTAPLPCGSFHRPCPNAFDGNASLSGRQSARRTQSRSKSRFPGKKKDSPPDRAASSPAHTPPRWRKRWSPPWSRDRSLEIRCCALPAAVCC